jgi:hypothetical protein
LICFDVAAAGLRKSLDAKLPTPLAGFLVLSHFVTPFGFATHHEPQPKGIICKLFHFP